MPQKPRERSNGFTLIELSIVLVIIGLLVGGILMGQTMIRQAGLRSITTDVEHIKTAVAMFEVKYNCLPGDCDHIELVLGTNSNGCTGAGAEGGPTGTCNGNGDGRIADNHTGIWEYYTAWQQLAEAGLVSGTYLGKPDNGGIEATPGVNIPISRVQGVGYGIGYFNIAGNFNPGYQIAGSIMTHRIVAAAKSPALLNGAAFASANELMALEQKMDDGNPVTGQLTGGVPSGYDSHGYVGECYTWGASVTDPTIHYITNDRNFCYMVFDLKL